MHLILEHATPNSHHTGMYRDPVSGEVFAHDLGDVVAHWGDGHGAPTGGVQRLVLHDHAGHQGGSPDQDAQSWLASWSQSGWERFDSSWRQSKARAESLGIELMIQPSSLGMLSDAISTLNWCTRGGGQDSTLLLDPMGWIVPSMIRDLGDHLDRINERCIQMIEHGRVGLVLLRSTRSIEAGGLFEPASMAQGELDTGLILSGLAGLIAGASNIAVLDEQDLGLLGPTGASAR